MKIPKTFSTEELNRLNKEIEEVFLIDPSGVTLGLCYHLADVSSVLIRRIQELEAARRAYASEFPPNKDGNPDVGSIHENIRKLKALAK